MEFVESMIVGTAGHIDHGKTALVRALTGVDTDRLKEEKARGISIELGLAYTPLAGGDVLGFVDVPGHERLVHTMVAGAGGIDFALLVIAADDGVMPQTREHLTILGMLGVDRGVVALTKIDRVDEARIRAVNADIETILAATTLSGAAIFPVNAVADDDPGIAALRAHLHGIAADWPTHPVDGLFRLAVDRVFTLPGHGTIATGTVRAGSVRVGDTVAVMPARAQVRVRSIHAQNREAVMGRAGQRCALNLVGIEKAALNRGDWLADPRALAPTTRIDVRLRRLADGAPSLPPRAPLHIHLGTAHRVAKLRLLEGGELAADTSVYAQLLFEAPICASAGDAFIVRDAQARHTIGGGVVLDPAAPLRYRRGAERIARLDAIQRLLAGDGIEPLLRQAPQGIAMRDLVRLCGRAPAHIAIPAAARVIEAAGEHFIFLTAHWKELLDRAASVLRAFHIQHPDEPGVDRGRLRRMTTPSVADPVWRRAIEELTRQQLIQHSGHWLHLPGHRVSLSEPEQLLAQQLQAAIRAGRFDPPWVRDLAKAVHAPEDHVRGVLRKCMAQGVVHQIVRDLFYDRAVLRELADVARELVREHGVIEAARYRDTVGLGRKRTIQILEFFDRVGYTRRTRDARVLRADSSWHDEV
jgi:selenocysteine-specific elongation factor